MDVTRPPLELLRLRTTIAYALEVIEAARQYAEVARDVNAVANPAYAGDCGWLLDHCRAALDPRAEGSPASLLDLVQQLLGEKPRMPDVD